MDKPESTRTPEEITLQLSVDLVRMRDALVTLSLAMNDLVFEASLTDGPFSPRRVKSAMENLKPSEAKSDRS